MGRSNTGIRAESVVQVVLVGVGSAPKTVAHVLRDVMNVTITDMDALVESTPLVLFEELDPSQATNLRRMFHLAGATVELKKARESHQGFNRPMFKTRPRKAA